MGSGGGPERAEFGKEVDQIKPDPYAGVVGMLIGDRRLTDRSAIISEFNVISQTKVLSPDEQEVLANRILTGRENLGVV
ncbi:hypothetical protein A3A49_00485 [Candidatus Curtissbacteria bacterium RIFCSPLOWO2_01_FULL_38_11b]|uniref:Uncharacterized protein n=1 Tax=Candidatus Curtissbacteria bacterium RIFCSPLOWO2_01_FULL_38_11b TaxID=1797725 RepID=A0A1F5H2R0_9BACT|nr:MAG: hypothetical protein A3A49_00485 [Candidatus Curtissbacteria bacterium RIFCSPLOWO2_01_FULL_38_11b]